MNVDPTTQPLPPMGQTTTPTPLSVEGIMAHNIEPDTLRKQLIPALNNKNSLYYGKYTIDRDQTTKTTFFQYDLQWPLGKVNNLYYKQPDNNGNLRMLITWAMFPVYFSRTTKVDFIQVHQPVKVSDCAVSFDVINRYSGKSNENYDTDAFTNDALEGLYDDTDDHFIMLTPSYWATGSVPTRYTRYLKNIQPAFIPKTVSSYYIRSPYVPNALQPDSFDVLVYIIPIISIASTMVSPTRTIRFVPNADNFIALPYVFNKETI
jgi:hypothetical protein